MAWPPVYNMPDAMLMAAKAFMQIHVGAQLTPQTNECLTCDHTAGALCINVLAWLVIGLPCAMECWAPRTGTADVHFDPLYASSSCTRTAVLPSHRRPIVIPPSCPCGAMIVQKSSSACAYKHLADRLVHWLPVVLLALRPGQVKPPSRLQHAPLSPPMFPSFSPLLKLFGEGTPRRSRLTPACRPMALGRWPANLSTS